MLENNTQVPSGSTVTLNISSLPQDYVSCVFAPDGQWGDKEVPLCSTTPPESCDKYNPSDRYKKRTRFKDNTTLEIQDVRPDESGIYKCETRLIPSSRPILISGIIVVGMFFIQNKSVNKEKQIMDTK